MLVDNQKFHCINPHFKKSSFKIPDKSFNDQTWTAKTWVRKQEFMTTKTWVRKQVFMTTKTWVRKQEFMTAKTWVRKQEFMTAKTWLRSHVCSHDKTWLQTQCYKNIVKCSITFILEQLIENKTLQTIFRDRNFVYKKCKILLIFNQT